MKPELLSGIKAYFDVAPTLSTLTLSLTIHTLPTLCILNTLHMFCLETLISLCLFSSYTPLKAQPSIIPSENYSLILSPNIFTKERGKAQRRENGIREERREETQTIPLDKEILPEVTIALTL